MVSKIDPDAWIQTVRDGGILSERDLRVLCEKIKELLIEESNTCGGEFVIYSLLELFLRNQTKVIFVASANSYQHYL